jgi:hypothetical protein
VHSEYTIERMHQCLFIFPRALLVVSPSFRGPATQGTIDTFGMFYSDGATIGHTTFIFPTLVVKLQTEGGVGSFLSSRILKPLSKEVVFKTRMTPSVTCHNVDMFIHNADPARAASPDIIKVVSANRWSKIFVATLIRAPNIK